MHLRRFTPLTSGFSKRLCNLKAAVAVFTVWYKFCRVHQTLCVTPAMEAKQTGHVLDDSRPADGSLEARAEVE
jgi:hypothetical protein